jgi:murein DD-endopeptidase MepM/ murein hydrolase activator NlpD
MKKKFSMRFTGTRFWVHRNSKLMKRSLFYFAMTFCALVATIAAHAGTPPQEARVPGGVALVRIADAKAPAPVVTRDGKRIWVTKHSAGKQLPGWYAVVGLPLNTAPGQHSLNVKSGGVETTQTFRVLAKRYPVQKLTFTDKGMVDPAQQNMERIEREAKHLGEIRRTWRERDDTDAQFVAPANGRLSSRFGLQRVLNGKPRSPHAGLDIAVPTGTRINSAANGTVIDAGDYYFTGKTVYIDHGNGLLTMYCHLSEISVMTGDNVAKGQAIGLSGMTGRATGPHLHWSVVLNGVMVEPELFLPKIEQ